MIEGISHMTFVVENLDKSSRLFETVFDAKPVYSSGDNQFSISEERFFLIGDIWIALMKGVVLPTKTYNHIAFKIPEEEFDKYAERVKRSGAEIKEGRPRISEEGSSLYFYDFDGHLFELHTGTLETRLARYRQSD